MRETNLLSFLLFVFNSKLTKHSKRAAHVVPENETARLLLLKQTKILDSDRNDLEFDRFSGLSRRILEVCSLFNRFLIHLTPLITRVDGICFHLIYRLWKTMDKIQYWHKSKKSKHWSSWFHWCSCYVPFRTWSVIHSWFIHGWKI